MFLGFFFAALYTISFVGVHILMCMSPQKAEILSHIMHAVALTHVHSASFSFFVSGHTKEMCKKKNNSVRWNARAVMSLLLVCSLYTFLKCKRFVTIALRIAECVPYVCRFVKNALCENENIKSFDYRGIICSCALLSKWTLLAHLHIQSRSFVV